MRRALRLSRPVYYGWVMLLAVSCTEVVSWGILYYAFSVFIAPMQAELAWTPVALNTAFSLMLLCSGLVAVPVGRWLDKHGPRALMTSGSILGTLLLVGWSQVTNLWAFYGIMAGIGCASAAVLYEPAFAIVATWFRHERGRALTLLTFFGAWASFLFIPLSAWLVDSLGWRSALLALAALLAALTILPHALLLRRRPQDLGLLPDGNTPTVGAAAQMLPPEQSVSARTALRESRFWLLTVAFAASTIAGVSMTVQLIPYLINQGHTPHFAALVAGLFGLMSLLGRLTIGPLGNRYPRPWVTAGLMAMQAIGLGTLAIAPTVPGALVYIALFGAGSGTLTIMRAALLAEQYGAAHYGTINGAQNVALTAARTVAPIAAGLLAATPAGANQLLWVLVALVTLGIAATLLARAP